MEGSKMTDEEIISKLKEMKKKSEEFDARLDKIASSLKEMSEKLDDLQQRASWGGGWL